MGLLDDAIREHLELKRLRGVDPGEVARDERDALGPVQRRSGHSTDSGAEFDSDSSADQSSSETGTRTSPSPSPSAVAGVDASGETHLGQETVEINMEAELADIARTESSGAEGEAPIGDVGQASGEPGDSLEWEMPGDPDREESPREAEPGEREADDGHIEDVLEETPDFLRDTPEQERLWFEQRPPRDFDFNE